MKLSSIFEFFQDEVATMNRSKLIKRIVYLLLVSMTLFSRHLWAYSVGPSTATIATNVANWTNWTSSQLSSKDDQWATTNQTAATGTLSGFDFSGIPAGSIIDGIVVHIQASESHTLADGYLMTYLSWDDGTSYTEGRRTPDSGELGTSDTDYEEGGASDTWGHSWTVSEVTSTFKAKIWGYCATTARLTRVDYVAVTVYYSVIDVSNYTGGTPTVPPSKVYQDTTKNCLGTFHFDGKGEISQITLTEYGTCDADTDLDNVKLFLDDGDGNWEASQDTTQLGSTTTFNTSNKATFSSLSLTAGSTCYVHVNLDVLSNATTGQTVGIELYRDDIVSTSTTTASSWPVQLGTSTISMPQVTVSNYTGGTPTVPPSEVYQDTTKNCLGTFHFDGKGEISQITLTEYGTCDADTDLDNVKLFLDDGDGNWEASQDTTQLGSTTTFNTSNKATFSSLGLTAGSTCYVHVNLDVLSNATTGQTVGIELYQNDIICTSTTTASSWPVQLGISTVTIISAGWTAYNDSGNDGDIATYGSPGNVTNFGVEFAPTSGTLKKYSDGTNTEVSMAYSGTAGQLLEGAGCDESHGNPSYPPSGTDAYTEFGTVINMGKISYANSGYSMTVTFSGVSTAKTYTLVVLGMRGNSTYTRWSSYTISGVSSATNSSSTGIPEADRTGYTTKYNAGDNWTNGYVAKWTNIVPSGTSITLTIIGVAYGGYAADKGYLSAIKLVEEAPAQTNVSKYASGTPTVPPSTVDNGTTGNCLGTFKFSGSGTISQIIITEYGTCDAVNDLENIKLFQDDGDGNWESGQDTTQLGSTTTFSGTSSTATFSGFNLTAGANCYVHVVLDVKDTATVNNTIGIEISASTDVTSTKTVSASSWPVELGTSTITIPQVTVSKYTWGSPLVPPSKVYQGTTKNCLGTFRFNGSGTISQITLTEYGTCDAASDLENVKLFEDDGDGNWESGNDTTQLGSTTTFSGASSTATFSGFSLTAGATCYVHVVLDVLSEATTGQTAGIELYQDDIVCTSTTTASSWPVQLGTSTISIPQVTVSKYSEGSPAVPPGTVYKQSTGNCLGTFRFDGLGTISQITLTEYGTCDATNDLENAKLFQDDGDGNWESSQDTTQLGSTTTFNGSNKATFSSLNLTASANCYVHVVLDVNSNPTDDETVGIELYQDDIVCTTTTTASGWPVQLGTSNIATYTGQATVAFMGDARPRNFGDGESQLTNDLNQVDNQMESGWTLDAVQTTGDMDYISEAGQQTFDDAYAVSDVSTIPVFYCVGNHETDNSYDMPVLRNKFSGYSFNPSSGPTNCEETTYSFDVQDIHVVVINEYYNGTSDTGTDGDVVDALFDWLKDDLRNTTKPYKVIVGHEPAYPIVRHVGDSLDGHPDNRNRFWNLLKTERVMAYFTGHDHNYHFTEHDGVFECDTGVSGGVVGGSGYDNFATIFYSHFDQTNGFQLRAAKEDPSWSNPTVVTKTRSDLENQVMVNTAERAGTTCSYFIDYTAADQFNPNWSGNNSSKWWESAFNTETANWNNGELSVGYDTGGAWPWMNTAIDNKNGVYGVFTRLNFNCYDKSSYNQMILQVDYNDAVTVWLNGTQIYKSSNAPTVGANDIWDKTASSAHTADGDGDRNPDYTNGTIDLTSYMSSLNEGSNLLAIGNWNNQTGSTELAAGIKLYLTKETSETNSFQDGVYPTASYNGTRDTHISGDNPNTNYGTTTPSVADGDAPDASCIIKWDISSIPQGVTVTTVTITVNVTNESDDIYEMYEMKRDWVETEATWNIYSTGNNWTEAGAQSTTTDRGATVLGSITSPATTGSKTIYLNSSGVALVQAWIDGAKNNYGFIFQDYTAATNGIQWTSREGTTASQRPKLTVKYTTPQTIVSGYTDGTPTVPPSIVDKGSTGNCLGTFKFSGSGTISKITITEYGTCDAPNDLENVKLFQDDGDGNWEPGEDTTQLGSTTTFSGASSTATFSGFNLVACSTCYAHVVLDVKNTASVNDTIGIEISLASNITSTEDITAASWPVQLGKAYIGPITIVSNYTEGTPPVPPYSVDRLSTHNCVGTFHFGGIGDISQITLTEYGTCDAASDLENIKLFQDDGDGNWESSQDTTQLGSTTTFSASNKATFSSLSLTAGSTCYVHIVLDVTSNATSGETLGIELYQSDIVCTSTTTASSWPVQLGTSYIGPLVTASKYTGGSPAVPPSSVGKPSSGNCLGTFRFGGSGTISQVTITEYGTCDAESVLENVKLFQDDGDGNWESSQDTTQLGSTTTFNVSNKATFSSLNLTAGSTCYVHVVLDVNSNAMDGRTVGIELYQNDIVCTSTTTASSWPVQLGISTIQSLQLESFQDGVYPTASYNGTRDTHIRSDNPTSNYGATSPSLTDGSAPDASCIIKWDISSISQGVTVTTVTITVNVTNETTDTYEIYEMKRDWIEGNNTSGSGADWNTYDGSTNWAEAGAQSTTTDRGSTVLGSITSPATTGSKTIYLNSSGLALVQAWINGTKNNYGFIFQDYTSATNGIQWGSREAATATNRPKLTVYYIPVSNETDVSAYTGGTPIAPPSSVDKGTSGNCLGTFKFGGQGTVSQITLTEYGTCDAPNDLENVKLFQDDGDGNWELAQDTTQLGSTTTFSGASSTATFSGFSLTAGATCYVHVVLGVKDTATATNTIGIQISTSTDVTSTETVAASSWPVQLGTSIIGPATIVSNYTGGTPTVPPSSVTRPSTHTCLGTFLFDGTGTISQITLTEYGNCDADTDLGNVKLFQDDGDGNWESTQDTTQLGSTTTFSGSSSTATFSGLSLTAGSTCYVHVVLDVLSNATNGQTVGIELYQDDIVCTSTTTASSWPVQLGTSYIGPVVIISNYTGGSPSVPPSKVYQGITKNCLGTFRFDGSGTISQVTITEYGTCDAESDLENVKLFEDDGDGNWESSQDTTQLGSTTTFNTSNKATFSSLSLTAGSTCYVHVVLDVKSTAPDGKTIGIELYRDDIISTSTTTASSWPVQLGVSTITAISPGWTAYNDLAGPSTGNVTNYSSGSGYTTAGYLVNYETGGSLSAYLSCTGNTYVGSSGAISNAGTDGYNIFYGKINMASHLAYQDLVPQVFTFTGLNPSKRYRFVHFGNRNAPTYDNARYSKVIISDVTSFDTDSSSGVTISTTTMTNDSATYCTGYNTVRGYVAGWTNINPGADGDFVITVTGPSDIYYAYSNAIMVEELPAANTEVSAYASGTPPVPPATVEIGDTGDCLGTFRLGGIGTISQIILTEYGSCDADGDLENVKLFEDDGDGNWESGQDTTQLGLTTTFNVSNKATFSSLSLTAGSTCYVHVVLDVKSDATTGNTVGIEIYQASDVNSTKDVTAASWPVQLGTSTIKVQDTIAPSAVTNLSALTGDYYAGQIDLSWTAPGDDGNTGNNVYGSYYTLKFATYSVSDLAGDTTAWWNSAYTYQQSWDVSNQGDTENKTLTGFTPGATYWFAIKTTDDKNNTSLIDTLAEGSQAWARAYEVHSSTGKYDFSESIGVTRWAWQYELANNESFNTTKKEQTYTTKTAFTEAMYSNIAAPDETNYENLDWKVPLQYIFSFQISVYENYVSNLHGSIKVQSEDATGHSLYIWNDTNSQWEQLDTSSASGAWEVLDGTKSATCADYIDSENKVSLSFFKADPGSVVKMIWTDYVFLEVSISPPTDTEAPSAITNLSALTGDNDKQIKLTWTAPGDDGETGNNTIAAYYTVKYATYAVSGSTENWWNGDQGVIKTYSQTWQVKNQGETEEHTLTMDEAGKEYWIAIKTTDEYGNSSGIHETSPVSAVSKAISTQPPGSPQIYAVYLSSITMTWTKQSEPDGYIMQASTNSNCDPVYKSSSTLDNNHTSLTVMDLDPNTTYYLRVGSLYSGTTEWISTPYPSTSTLANQVTNAQIYKVFDSSVTLTWDALPQTPSSSTCEGYIVQASTKNNFDPIYKSSSTTDVNISTLTVVGLDAGTTYWFRVGSLNWLNVANYVIVGSTKTSGGIEPGDRYWVASSAGDWNDPDNWSTSSGGAPPATVPSSPNKAIFDGAGLGNCSIDVDASVTDVVIYSTYTATVSINTSQSLTTSSFFSIAGGTFTTNGEILDVGSYTQTGGIFNAGGSTVTCNGNFSVTVGTFNAGASVLVLDATGGNATFTGDGYTFNNVIFQSTATVARTWTLGGGAITFNGDFKLKAQGSGNLTVNASTNNPDLNIGGSVDYIGTGTGTELVSMGNGIWTVGGNVDFSDGTVDASTSTFVLNGTSTKTLTMDGNSLNILQITNSSSDGVYFADNLTLSTFTATTGNTHLYFCGGSTFTFTNIELDGQSESSRIILKSTSTGTAWYLTVTGTQSVSYVDVEDSDASGGNTILAIDGTSLNSGNNVKWDFGPPAAITDLTGLCDSPTGNVTLSWSTPGDDGWNNTLPDESRYIIDYSSYSVQWSTTTYDVEIPTHSVAPHTQVSYTITGLTGDTTWYFQIWTRDEVPTNWSGLSNGATIWVNPVLGVSISTNTYDFSEVPLGQSTHTVSVITVTNDGNINETYSLKISSVTLYDDSPSLWKSTDTTTGHNRFIFYAIFHGTDVASGYFELNDAVVDENRSSTSDRYTYEDGSPPYKQTGASVPADEERKIWFRLDMPTSTTTGNEEKIRVTITAGPE